MSTKRTRKCPEASGRQKRTAGRCRSIADLRAAALHRLPRAVFDFVDGGADDERTLRGNVAAYSQMRFQPRALVDVSNVETQVCILERLAALPIIIAPFGAARFPWPVRQRTRLNSCH